jgi:transposase
MAEHPKKQLAYLLFMDNGMEAKQISDMLDVSENTISKWNRAEGWKEQRQARTLSPDKLIRHYYEQSELVLNKAKKEDRPLTSNEMDGLNKLASAIQKLDKKVDPSITMAVFKNFGNYLMQIDPVLTKQLSEHQLNYIQLLLNESK